MKRISLTVIVLLFPFLLGADYVCHTSGQITEIVYSKGKSYSSRADCIKVSRDKLQTINKAYWKVDPSIIGTNDEKIIEKTQDEKDAYDAAVVQALEDADNARVDELRVDMKDMLTALVKVYNSKVPAQYQITKQEIIIQIKQDRGLIP